MKAYFYERQGSAEEVLQFAELADPLPLQGEVRVRLAFSGLNPTDIKNRTGFAGAPLGYPCVIPHQDGAGTIDLIGPGVPESMLGQRVWIYEAQAGRAHGTAAEYIVISSANVVPLPEHIPFEVGACLGIPAITAHRCLFADGEIKDKWVLIQGGAGAVGSAAILLAKWAGAKIITTISRKEQEEVVGRLGADVIINRKHEDVAQRVMAATNGEGVERIVEVDLISNASIDGRCLKNNGAISCYATDDPQGMLNLPFLPTMFKCTVLRFVFVYNLAVEAKLRAIADITACLESDMYHPFIGLVLPLSRIADAHKAQEDGSVIGKILLSI